MTARSRANAGRNYAAPLLRFRRLMRVFTGQRSGSPVGSVLQLIRTAARVTRERSGTFLGLQTRPGGGLTAGMRPWFCPF